MALWLCGPMAMWLFGLCARASVASHGLLAPQPLGSSASWLSRLPPLGARLLGFRPMALMALWLWLWIYGSSRSASVGLWLGGFQAHKAAMASVPFWLYGSMDPVALRPLAAACGSKALRPAWPSGSMASRSAAAPAMLAEHQMICLDFEQGFSCKMVCRSRDFGFLFHFPSSDVALRPPPSGHRPPGHRPQAPFNPASPCRRVIYVRLSTDTHMYNLLVCILVHSGAS